MGNSRSFPMVSFSKDHVVIVTGGNTGLGYHTAKRIAMMGANVIIACRSEEKALRAIRKMKEEFKEEKHKGTPGFVVNELFVEFIKLDCASLKSVVEFADKFKSTKGKLHTFIANAGIALHRQGFYIRSTTKVIYGQEKLRQKQKPEYTEDNHELHFQVNYLSQFLLMALLLPVMKISGDDCRIIMVSSYTHSCGNFNIDTIEGRQYNENNFDRIDYYGRSKLYQIMQMFSMNRRLRNTNVTVNAVSPGTVRTNITDNFRDMKLLQCIMFCFKACGVSKHPVDGAKTQINCAVNPHLKGVRDTYHAKCRPKCVSRLARNKEKQEALWKYSMECLKDYMPADIVMAMEGKSKPI